GRAPERVLVTDRRAERGHLEPQLLDWRRKLAQLRREDEPQAVSPSGRLTQRDLPPPRSLLDETRTENELSKRASAALRTNEQAVDQQLEHSLELEPRCRLRQLDRFDQRLAKRSRLERCVE